MIGLAAHIVPVSGTIVPNMGKKAAKPAVPAPTGLADALFTPVQQRVLGLLFGQPQRRYQSAELIRLASSGTGTAHRLLTRLAAAGLEAIPWRAVRPGGVQSALCRSRRHRRFDAGSRPFRAQAGARWWTGWARRVPRNRGGRGLAGGAGWPDPGRSRGGASY